jgi:hypothetical protein
MGINLNGRPPLLFVLGYRNQLKSLPCCRNRSQLEFRQSLRYRLRLELPTKELRFMAHAGTSWMSTSGHEGLLRHNQKGAVKQSKDFRSGATVTAARTLPPAVDVQ